MATVSFTGGCPFWTGLGQIVSGRFVGGDEYFGFAWVDFSGDTTDDPVAP